jgi:hypothetical protein
MGEGPSNVRRGILGQRRRVGARICSEYEPRWGVLGLFEEEEDSPGCIIG